MKEMGGLCLSLSPPAYLNSLSEAQRVKLSHVILFEAWIKSPQCEVQC